MTLLLSDVDEDFLKVLEALVEFKGDVKMKDISDLKLKKIKELKKREQKTTAALNPILKSQTTNDKLVGIDIDTEVKEIVQKRVRGYVETTKVVTDYVEKRYIEKIPSISYLDDIAFNNIKVMVVEDDAINQNLMKHLLKDPGIHVTIVENGKLAVEQRIQNDFDIVFMDIAMATMDGIEATKMIKSYETQNYLKNVPIIAVTANALKGDRERFMAQGFDEYCTKPVKKSTIIQMLDRFLPSHLKGKKERTRTVVKRVPQTVLKKVKIPKEVTKSMIISQPLRFRKFVYESSLIDGNFDNYMDILICKSNKNENSYYKTTLIDITDKIDISNNPEEIEKLLQNKIYKVIITDQIMAEIYKSFILKTNPGAKVVVITKDISESLNLYDAQIVDFNSSKIELPKIVKRYVFS